MADAIPGDGPGGVDRTDRPTAAPTARTGEADSTGLAVSTGVAGTFLRPVAGAPAAQGLETAAGGTTMPTAAGDITEWAGTADAAGTGAPSRVAGTPPAAARREPAHRGRVPDGAPRPDQPPPAPASQAVARMADPGRPGTGMVPASRRRRSEPAPPDVHITIGSVEVRAADPPPAPRPVPPPALMTLECYLDRRDRGGSR